MEKLIEIAAIFAAKNHPKYEVNYTCVDNSNVVATDTTILLAIKHGETVETPLLLKTGKDDSLGCDLIFKGIPANDKGRYPEYSRVLSREIEVIYRGTDVLEAAALYPFFNMSQTAFINLAAHGAKLKKLQKFIESVEVLKIKQGGNSPLNMKLKFKSWHAGQVAIMPTIIHK